MKTLLETTRDRFLLALQYRDYRNLWIATTFSASAAWALIIARGWLAFELTDGSLWVGIVTFAAIAPRVVSTPIAGFLADRFDRQKLLQWIFALNMGNNVLLAVLVMYGLAGPWTLTFLALANGTLRAAQMTMTTALIPNLVPREHLLNAIALNQATQQGARMVGALAIVPLLGFVNIEAAFWLCSGFYLVGFMQVSRVATRSTGVIDKSQSFLTNLFEGFVYVYKRPIIMSMVLMTLAHCALTIVLRVHPARHIPGQTGGRFGGRQLPDRRDRRRGVVGLRLLGRHQKRLRQRQAVLVLRHLQRTGTVAAGMVR